MPFHIDEVKSEVTVMDGDLPLTEQQMDKLVAAVAKRLAKKSRDAANARQESSINRHVAPALRVGE